MGVGDIIDAVRLRGGELLWTIKNKSSGFSVRKKAWMYALCACGGVGILILIIALTTAALNSRQEKASAKPPAFPAQKIPDEELFVPEEPDFLPPVLLYREQKDQWTAEDAAPFWTDPAELGDGGWSDKVEEYVDSLLKSVP
jgi:hypothetical protein